MDSLLGYLRYIGSFEKLPETAEPNDIALSKGFIYIWQDNWQEVKPIYIKKLF